MVYDIVVKGDIIGTMEKPRYIKRSPTTDVYIECAESVADGIAVGGQLYNIHGKSAIPDAENAVIIARDSGNHIASLNRQAAVLTLANILTENAVRELDENYDERIAVIEDALCDLDNG